MIIGSYIKEKFIKSTIGSTISAAASSPRSNTHIVEEPADRLQPQDDAMMTLSPTVDDENRTTKASLSTETCTMVSSMPSTTNTSSEDESRRGYDFETENHHMEQRYSNVVSSVDGGSSSNSIHGSSPKSMGSSTERTTSSSFGGKSEEELQIVRRLSDSRPRRFQVPVSSSPSNSPLDTKIEDGVPDDDDDDADVFIPIPCLQRAVAATKKLGDVVIPPPSPSIRTNSPSPLGLHSPTTTNINSRAFAAVLNSPEEPKVVEIQTSISMDNENNPPLETTTSTNATTIDNYAFSSAPKKGPHSTLDIGTSSSSPSSTKIGMLRNINEGGINPEETRYHHTVDDDPYEWAYEVWRKKKLLPPKESSGMTRRRRPKALLSHDNSNPTSERKQSVGTLEPTRSEGGESGSRTHLLSLSKSMSSETSSSPSNQHSRSTIAGSKGSGNSGTNSRLGGSSDDDDNEDCFANVLHKWKSISHSPDSTPHFPMPPDPWMSQQPTTSVSSKSEVGVSSLSKQRRYTYQPQLRSIETAIGVDSNANLVKNKVTPSVIPQQQPTIHARPRENNANTPSTMTSSRAPGNRSRQENLLQESSSSLSPIHETPKSQAWKLKMGRQLQMHPNMQQPSSRSAQRHRRASIASISTSGGCSIASGSTTTTKPSSLRAPTMITTTTNQKNKSGATASTTTSGTAGSGTSRFLTCKSPPMSRRDYKSVVQDFLRGAGSVAGNTNVSSPSHERQVSPKVPQTATKQQLCAPAAVENESESKLYPRSGVVNNNKQRSKSQPRPRTQSLINESSVSAIRYRLQREKVSGRKSLLSVSSGRAPDERSTTMQKGHSPTATPGIRVMDLSIDDYDDNELAAKIRDGTDTIPREVQIATKKCGGVPSSDSTEEMFSPFTQRVMRNLEKIYNSTDDFVPTPKGAATYSDRPWQRDRFLNRMDHLTKKDTPSNQSPEFRCTCSNSIFSGNDDMIEFYLPLMGTACSCGKKTAARIIDPDDEPTSLVHILRPWQVEFLGGFGIYRGEELVKANHRSGTALANALQRYRKKEGMTPFRVKSCIMALQIWSKTCKAFVRSIRNQIKQAKQNNTAALLSQSEVTATNDDTTTNVRQPVPTALRVPNTLYILASFLDQMPKDVGAMSMVPTSSNTTASTATTNPYGASISTCTQFSPDNISSSATTPTSLNTANEDPPTARPEDKYDFFEG